MLVPAIEHMIRNSVAHGIEEASVRQAAGKDVIGKINVHSRNEGRYANIVIKDDGAGINFARVHRKSIENGLMDKDHQPTQAELINALFMPGFSTATEFNETAGRGVGLDVVRDTIQRLGGRVSLSSEAGKGTRFTIQVPLSSTHVSGLLMSVQGKPYIVPSALVRTVETVPSKLVSSSFEGKSDLQLEDGTKASLVRLHDVCGVRPPERMSAYSTLVAPHDSQCVVFADHVEYVDNAPVRSFDQQNFGRGVLGHSILSDGRVALVINLKEAISMRSDASPIAGNASVPALKAKREKKVLVMVVDDSITVRALSKRFLTKNGFDVVVAVNGAEAVEKLMEAKTLPDLILMDIEMPVMDGFEATTTIKSTPQLASVPIAFISSRNAEKHRDHAKSIGATAFFGKPYSEEAVLALIKDIVGEEDFKNSAFVESVLEKAA
jgi:chemosensory pili system protein ChpA (sensor histidine kinase/response regulator)